MSAQGGGQQGEEDPQTEAIRTVMDCVMFARRNRYYPFRAKMTVDKRNPDTGRWISNKPAYLDTIARWYEDGLTFIALTESVGPEGGTDVARRPHAVVAVPNSAFAAVPAAESHRFNVSFLYRWGPESSHTTVPVELTRSMSFNYRYRMLKPVEFFTEPKTNPRASRVNFEIYFTWDCEQDFREALNTGMTRNEVLKRMSSEMEAWRQRMKQDGVKGVPSEKVPLGPGGMPQPMVPPPR